MFEKLKQDLYLAQKERDTLRVSVLRFLISSIKDKEIELRTQGGVVDDELVFKTIKKQIKQRREAAEGYEKVGRPDSAEKDLSEMAVLKEYMPEEDVNANQEARTQ